MHVSNMVDRTYPSSRPANVLYFPYGERFDVNLTKTGHNFFLASSNTKKPIIADREDIPNIQYVTDVYSGSYDVIFAHDLLSDEIIRLSITTCCPILLYRHQTQDVVLYHDIKKSQQTIAYGVGPSAEYERTIDVLSYGSTEVYNPNIVDRLSNEINYTYVESKEIFYDDYKKLFASAKVYLNFDGFNYHLLEAMSAGCQIVTLPFDGSDTLLGHNALYVDSLSTVKSAIKHQLAAPPNLKNIESVRTYHSLDNFVSIFSAILHDTKLGIFCKDVSDYIN